MSDLIVCTPKRLPQELRVAAAQRSLAINPANQPLPAIAARALGSGDERGRERLSLLVGARWPSSGVKLTVGFVDAPPADLRTRIILHMNAWGKSANVAFVASASDPKIRIARHDHPAEMSGYWSYVGTQILSIPDDQPTMNLQAFTMDTPESEFRRVVRHETGHTLGFPHEHMRRQLVAKIDPDKAIAYFGLTQGWTPDEVREQVLTALEDSSLLATAHADTHSIMCYQIPGSLTRNGKPIIGGKDIDKRDYAFAASCYPKPSH
ncbi:MAG: peptidase M12 [Betaproteobacteria bacterium]